jgi:hypothetical protein
MNKLLRQWVRQEIKNVLKESQGQIEKYAKAPADAALGRIAFADQRKDLPQGIEPNNKAERRLVQNVKDYIAHNAGLTNNDATLIKSFLENDYYNDVFVQPTGKLYRGMVIDPEGFENLTGLEPPEFEEDEEKKIGGFEFVPWYKISSWTTSMSVAREFAMNTDTDADFSTDGDIYGIVMIANVSDNPNLFIDVAQLYGLDEFTKEFEDQNECLGLDNINVSEAILFKVENPYL